MFEGVFEDRGVVFKSVTDWGRQGAPSCGRLQAPFSTSPWTDKNTGVLAETTDFSTCPTITRTSCGPSGRRGPRGHGQSRRTVPGTARTQRAHRRSCPWSCRCCRRIRASEAGVDLVARDGRGREVDRAPVDGQVLVAAAEDIEDVIGAADERLHVDVAVGIVENPLVVVAVEGEGEDGVAAGLGGPLAEWKEKRNSWRLGSCVGIHHKSPRLPHPTATIVNLDALQLRNTRRD